MSQLGTALSQIEEFVNLARERRRRALPSDERERLETLDEAIRDAIDGARPAPKRIANPAPARPAPVAAAAARTTPSAGVAAPKLSGALEQVLEMSAQDQKKVSEVRLEDLPVSAYTPPVIPAFMADYFSDDLIPARVPAGAVPSRVVSTDGERLELKKETRVLLGLEKPKVAPRGGAAAASPGPTTSPNPTTSREAANVRSSAPAPAANEDGMPVIVHLMQGGTRRGALEYFDPEGENLELTDGFSLPLREVLAVFFGLKKGDPPTPASGQQVVVKLVNDKQVSGVTSDYEEGAMALTVVPEPRRGNIDRIWVPAWAVKGIEI
jgi:hypothetical protein